jgi:hypothetical protein
MKTINYTLSFVELGGILLFFRDYEWKPAITRNRILEKYIYDTCKLLYERLERKGLQLIADKQMESTVEIEFSELEVLTISIMSQKQQHSNPNVKYSVNKIILDLPPEIRKYFEPINHTQSKKVEPKIMYHEKDNC